MAYITLDQAKQALGNDLYVSAYDDFNNPGTPSDEALQNDIDFITGVIDSALAQTYDPIGTPITGAKALAVLRGYSKSLIKYEAYRGFDDSEVPPVVVDRYREVERELGLLSGGKKFLPGQSQNTLSGAISYGYNSATNNTKTPKPVCRREDMSGI